MKAYILLCFSVGQTLKGVNFCSSIPGVLEVKATWGLYDAVAKVDSPSTMQVISEMRKFEGLLSTFCLPIVDVDGLAFKMWTCERCGQSVPFEDLETHPCYSKGGAKPNNGFFIQGLPCKNIGVTINQGN